MGIGGFFNPSSFASGGTSLHVAQRKARARAASKVASNTEGVSVDVITEAALPAFVSTVLAEDRAIETKLLNLQKRKSAEVESEKKAPVVSRG